LAGIQTNILIDEELKREAQERGIKLGAFMNQQLKIFLDKDTMLMELEAKKEYHQSEVRKLRKQIKDIKERKAMEEKRKGSEAERLQKALKTAILVHANEGGLNNERIRQIAEQQLVDGNLLIEKVEEYFSKKTG
jgi:uncharacterized protein (UPF0305 family)